MALNVAVAGAGASGFIGKKLCQELVKAGIEVWPLVRKKPKNHEIFYDYQTGQIELEKLAHCQAVINLSGKNITSGLWTKKFKEELYDSRIKTTELLAKSINRLQHGPSILLNASAVGIYGDRADFKLDETAKFGHDFLAQLCVDWEKATHVAKRTARVVNMRFGIVFDKDGGFLKKQLPLFKLGLGLTIGSGDQYISYVTRDELVKQIMFVLENPAIKGPVNMVSLNPITQKDFMDAIRKILKRPQLLKLPKFLFKSFDQGQMLSTSTRAYPKVLLDHGFNFSHQNIEQVLRDLL